MKKVIATFIAAMITTTTFACDAPATNYCTTCGYVWAYCQCGGGGGTYYSNSSYSSGNGNVYVYGNNYGVINNYSYVNNGYDYSVNYYDNDSYTEYAEYDGSYCLLCGLDWDTCTCYDEVVDVYPYEYGDDCYQQYSYGNCGEYDEYNETTCYYYDCSTYSESVYSECSTQMCHWANLRDECGNIIGVVDAGANVEICGPCADNPSRTIIYNYATGCYGTVASCYVYGASDYYYENPTEWCGNVSGSVECNNYCGGYIYDEDDVYAADNWEWIAQNGCGNDAVYDCGYDYYQECECDEYYEDEDENSEVFAWFCNGRLCNDNISVNIDLSNATINIYSGNSIILSGECDCSGLTCGEYTYCADYEAYCGGYGASLPSGCPMSVCE